MVLLLWTFIERRRTSPALQRERERERRKIPHSFYTAVVVML